MMTDKEKLRICLNAINKALQTAGTDAVQMELEKGLQELGINPYRSDEKVEKDILSLCGTGEGDNGNL